MKIKSYSEKIMIVKQTPTKFLAAIVIFLAIGIIILSTGIFSGVGPAFVAIVFIVIALAMIAFMDLTTLTIDKGTGIFVIDRKSIIGKKERRMNLSDIDHMEQVEMTKANENGKSPNAQKIYDAYLVLKNGDRVAISKETPFLQYSSFGSFFSHAKDLPIVKDMATFGGIQYVDNVKSQQDDILEEIQEKIEANPVTLEEEALIAPAAPVHQILNHPTENSGQNNIPPEKK